MPGASASRTVAAWTPLPPRRPRSGPSANATLLGQDAACSVVVPADGKYVIQVRDSAYGGNGACAYRLHVGTFPRPLAVVPAGGKRISAGVPPRRAACSD